MEEITGFVGDTTTIEEISKALDRVYFRHLFFINGLPHVFVVDDDSAFKGVVTVL